MSEPTMPSKTTEWATDDDTAYLSEPPAAKLDRGFTPARLAQEVTVETVLNETEYTVTIDATPYSYTSDASATAGEIRDGLISEINGSTDFEAEANEADSFYVTTTLVGEPFTLTPGTNLSAVSATVPGEKPPAEWINWPLRALYDLTEWFKDKLNLLPGHIAPTELTISSGSVTPTGSVHTVDTEADAAADDLSNIVTTNLDEGRVLYIRCADAARVVTVKHEATGAGEIHTADGEDVVLDDTDKVLTLQRVGVDWVEVAIGERQAVSLTAEAYHVPQADSTGYISPTWLKRLSTARHACFSAKSKTCTAQVTRSGSVATFSLTAHGIRMGDYVTTNGATQTEYNGWFEVQEVPTENTFTVNVSGSPVTPSTGTPAVKIVCRNSTGVSQIDYISAGHSRVYWTTAFTDAYYPRLVTGAARESTTYPTVVNCGNISVPSATGYCDVYSAAHPTGDDDFASIENYWITLEAWEP